MVMEFKGLHRSIIKIDSAGEAKRGHRETGYLV